MSRLHSWFLTFVGRGRFERELSDEMTAHIALRADDLERGGLARADAERQARREFGGMHGHKQDVRASVGLSLIDGLAGDARYVARSLRRHFVLSASIVATLSLTIGISTGVFTFLDSIALRPRIDRDRESFFRVRVAYITPADRRPIFRAVNLSDYVAYSRAASSAKAMTGYVRVGAALDAGDQENTVMAAVACNFFTVYVPPHPLLGRVLRQSDCDNSERVIVLSEPLWRRRYAADSGVVGRTVRINDRPVTIVGVLPAYAGQVDRSQAWLPVSVISPLGLGLDLAAHPEANVLVVDGLLARERSRADVAAELAVAAAREDQLTPNRRSRVIVTDGSLAGEPGSRLRILSVVGIVMLVLGLVVFIACTNVATLLLARAEARRREVAIRVAMGASHARLLQLMLAETMVLAAVAGAFSVAFAYRMPTVLSTMLTGQTFPWSFEPDWRVFAYLTAVTMFVGVIAGLVPARQALDLEVVDALKSNGATAGASRRRAPVYRRLIASQVALSFVLLTGAYLFHRAAGQMERVNVGHATRDLIRVGPFERDRNRGRAPAPLKTTVRPTLLALPSVRGVAFATNVPSAFRETIVRVTANEGHYAASSIAVSGDFFQTFDIRIVHGRALGDEESACASRSCPIVVSEELARRFFGGRDPVGATVRGDSTMTMLIVGVAADVQAATGMDGAVPIVYQPWAPGDAGYMAYARVSGKPTGAAAAIGVALRRALPDVPISIQSVESLTAEDTQFYRQLAGLIGMLAAIAVGLAMIGLYGVVAFSVKQRTREIGVRLALGAARRNIYGVVARGYAGAIGAGLAAGLAIATPVAVLATRVFDSGDMLPLFDRASPLLYGMAVVTMIGVCALAIAGPAMRAAGTDPLTAIRNE